MWKRRRTWFLRRLAVGLALAAIVAPAAQGYPDPGPQSAVRVQGTVCVPKWGCRASGPIRPDDRATRGVASTDVQPQAAPNNGAAPTQVVGAPRGEAPVIGTNAKSDIDWGDLGIGAGFAFALVLLAAGATVGTRHRHKSATA
jgi:hypothetical protein